MGRVQEQVQELATPVLERMNLELVQIEYQREGQGWVLRILIDKPGGVTLDDCQEFSRDLEAELDRLGVVDRSYMLEVASPGLDRPLLKREDYRRFSGEEVKVKTYAPINGRKTFEGCLEGLKGDEVELVVDDELQRIPLDKIAKANLVPDL